MPRQRRPHSRASDWQSSRSAPASDGDTAVTASDRAGPSTSLATQARKAESAPPLNATTTRSSSRRRARSWARSPIDDLEADALVALALRLGLGDPDAPHVGGRLDVGAAVGLLVEAHDVDDADLLHGLGDEVDLGADQVVVGQGLAPRQERDLDLPVGRQLCVDELFDARPEALGAGIELEVP